MPASSEAGPSNLKLQHQQQDQNSAPQHPLPSTSLCSIEFPGYVKEESVPKAIAHVGGQASLNRAFRRNATKVDALLELNWRPDNPFSHPVAGNVISTNKILLKVTRRRRRKRGYGTSEGGEDVQGEFVAEAVGTIPKTVRFRAIADYQYMPDLNDPVAQLRLAMDRMDVEAIKKYKIPPEKEDYSIVVKDPNDPNAPPTVRSNLRLFPPPIFSRQTIPHVYNYKANNMSVVTTVIDERTGEEKKRLINKGRWKGYGPTSLLFSDQTVPTEPPANVREAAHQADERVLTALKEKFEERPVWTRTALFNQFSPADCREITNSKILLPLVCYMFQDGPWRDTMVRFSYDPRTIQTGRFYQRLYFRNVNHPISRPSVVTRRHDVRASNSQAAEQESSKDIPGSHIFDGMHLTTETAAFQLCDIHDPMLKEMIEDEDAVRDECNERDGWYTTHALERIKAVLRLKFFSLLEGHVATEEECLTVLDPGATSTVPITLRDAYKRQPRKHNMAKGALRPEDAAVARLRATLENAARGRGKKVE